jgi:hypothetical protein
MFFLYRNVIRIVERNAVRTVPRKTTRGVRVTAVQQRVLGFHTVQEIIHTYKNENALSVLHANMKSREA